MSDEYHPARDWPVPHPSHDFDRNLWAKGCYACGALSEADLEAPCPNLKDPKHAYARKAEALMSANREGMVLDLSDLPVGCHVTLTQGVSFWTVSLSSGVECRTVYRNGTSPTEAYTAALKAWRENG